MLKETIAAGLRLKLIKLTQLARVNVDTTVQEKNIRYPTDARSLSRARERLVNLAKTEGIKLRQSYVRVGKQVLHQQSRYAHARQFKRARKAVKKLRTYLGRGACQVFCVWGSFISLEVGVDSLGVSEGQLGERLLPVGRHCSLNELARC